MIQKRHKLIFEIVILRDFSGGQSSNFRHFLLIFERIERLCLLGCESCPLKLIVPAITGKPEHKSKARQEPTVTYPNPKKELHKVLDQF